MHPENETRNQPKKKSNHRDDKNIEAHRLEFNSIQSNPTYVELLARGKIQQNFSTRHVTKSKVKICFIHSLLNKIRKQKNNAIPSRDCYYTSTISR